MGRRYHSNILGVSINTDDPIAALEARTLEQRVGSGCGIPELDAFFRESLEKHHSGWDDPAFDDYFTEEP